MPDPVTPASFAALLPLSGLLISAASAAATAALLTAAATDLGARRIPNRTVLVVAAGAVPMLASLDPWAALGHLGLAALLFLAGLAAFRAGLVGGGDVKLLAAVGLWAGPEGLGLHLLVQAVATLLLVPIVLGSRALAGGAADAAPLPDRPTVPLGVAIAAGGLAVILARLGYLGG